MICLNRAIILSQEIRELKNRIEALHNNPNHIDAKRSEIQALTARRELLEKDLLRENRAAEQAG